MREGAPTMIWWLPHVLPLFVLRFNMNEYQARARLVEFGLVELVGDRDMCKSQYKDLINMAEHTAFDAGPFVGRTPLSEKFAPAAT